MNEQDTRFNKIDPLLHEAGWRGTVPGAKTLNELIFTDGRMLGMGQRGKRERADYVLEYMGRKLAVIEAKSDDKGAAVSGAVTVMPGVEVYQLTKNGVALQVTLQGTKYWKDRDLN